MQETHQPHSPEGPTLKSPMSSVSGRPKRKWPLLLIVIIILLAVGVGAFFLLNRGPGEEPEKSFPEPIKIETEAELTPTPTPSPEPIDRSDVRSQILNGTGIAREGALLRDKLTEAGYSDFEVGNADEQTYTAAEVTFGPTVPEAVRTEILGILEDTYTDVRSRTGSLETVDILVITGLRPGQTLPTPTPAPSPTPTAAPTPSPTPTLTPTPTP